MVAQVVERRTPVLADWPFGGQMPYRIDYEEFVAYMGKKLVE